MWKAAEVRWGRGESCWSSRVTGCALICSGQGTTQYDASDDDPRRTIPASSGTVRRLVLVQSQQRDEAVSTVPGTPVGMALADGGFDVGSTPEDSQQVSGHVEVLPAHPSRRVVLARMESVAAEESQHMLHDGPQTAVPTQGDSDTETQDSRRSIVDVPEFDLTRGDSDEELIPVDSPGSEVEFEESIAGEEEAAPVSEEEFPDVLDVRAAEMRAAFRTLDDVDPCHQFRQRAAVKCAQNLPRSLQKRAEGCIERDH